MNHIDEGDLQAFLDAELRLPERRQIELHLEACARCEAAAARLRELGADFAAALRLLNVEPAGAGAAPMPPVGGRPARGISAGARRLLPRAAVFLFFLGAAASATVPGSPVRQWIVDLTPARPPAEVPAAVVEAPSTPAPLAREAGVFVDPVDGEVEVALHGANRVRIRAVVVDGVRAGVTGTGGAAASRCPTAKSARSSRHRSTVPIR